MVLDDNNEAAVIARMEIQRSLGRVEGKLDQIIAGITSHEQYDKDRFQEVHEQLDSINKRTATVERKFWYATGAVAAITFIVSHFPFNLIWK